jgi:phage tail sheath protein FI
MPITPTYPGVYIEEIPSGVRTITGVATSITAFVGYTLRGSLNKAKRIFNFGDYEREFGGLHPDSYISYGVQHFFDNGGSNAYVVRVAQNTAFATLILKYEDGENKNALEVRAADPGKWGDNLFLKVDYGNDSITLTSTFNLEVSRLEQKGKSPELLPVEPPEKYFKLSMNPRSAKYAPAVINSKSKLIRLKRSEKLFDGVTERGYSLSGDLSDDNFPTLTDEQVKITGILDGDSRDAFTLVLNIAPTAETSFEPPTDMAQLVKAIEEAIKAANLTDRLEVKRVNAEGEDEEDGNFLKLISKSTEAEFSSVHITAAPEFDAAPALKLGSDNGGREYEGARIRRPLEINNARLSGGGDGRPSEDANDILGSPKQKTGIYALKDVDLFNLLVIPGTTRLSESAATKVIQDAIKLCSDKRAFYIIDPPPNKSFDDIRQWAEQASRNKNAAIFFPRIRAADPQQEFRLRDMPASGMIAGIFARTDSERGVWKAAAGTDAVLRGAQGLSYFLTNEENGVLNQVGVNCLRTFSGFGTVVWGARTREGADQDASEWKYIPVRRLALYIEKTLYRATQWVVFEPNDEPLWAQIRLNIGAFMQDLFREGAFQGSTPREAYFVKCDKESTTQNDINLGTVNIVVGFAPLKPAEFVIIKIQQMAGQIVT